MKLIYDKRVLLFSTSDDIVNVFETV